MYQKAEIPTLITFQDSASLSCLQNMKKMLKYLHNDQYALKTERNERSGKQYKSPDRSNLRNFTGLEIVLGTF